MEEKLEMEGGGRLTFHREGPRAVISAVRPSDTKGLYKVWLVGAEGQTLLLGTLVPDTNGLELRRTVTVSELERAGCWPPVHARCRLAFAFNGPQQGKWYCEQHPEKLLSDLLVKRWVRGPMLCRREKAGFFLAAPFHTGRPVELTGLFCLAKIERWSNGVHLVWRFDASGRPVR